MLSAALLVVVNAIPLVGVLLWDWSLLLILVLYWIESGIIGVLNVFKMAFARAPEPEQPPGAEAEGGLRLTFRMNGAAQEASRFVLIPFFIMHYGIFWVVHGVFVFALAVFAGLGTAALDPDGPSSGPMDPGRLDTGVMLTAATGLAASHLVSFLVNYLGRREYLRATPGGQMMTVYGRVVILHLTILGGGALIGRFGTPVAALVVLVVLKTALDLSLHIREHRRAQIAASAPSGRSAPAEPSAR